MKQLSYPWDILALALLVNLFGTPGLAVAEGASSYWGSLIIVAAVYGGFAAVTLLIIGTMRFKDRLRY